MDLDFCLLGAGTPLLICGQWDMPPCRKFLTTKWWQNTFLSVTHRIQQTRARWSRGQETRDGGQRPTVCSPLATVAGAGAGGLHQTSVSQVKSISLPSPASCEVPRQFLPLLPRSVPTVKPLILSPLWTFGQSMAKTAATFLGPLCILHVYTPASPLSPDKPS